MDLILGACAGYQPHHIRHFAESLRRWYDGLAILVTAQLPPATKALLDRFGIRQIEVPLPGTPDTIPMLRYIAFQPVLAADPTVGRVFIVDVRDVLFQANPFDSLPPAPIVAFQEDEVIGACPINSEWIRLLYGPDRLAAIAGRPISCSGTTAGTRDGLLRYLDLMAKEVQAAGPKLIHAGCDQGMHNHLLYGALSAAAVMVGNRMGTVQTLAHQQQFLFDRAGRMLNADGTVCPVLHQIDRHPQFHGLLGVTPEAFLK